MTSDAEPPDLYAAARRVLDSGFGEDGSVFTPGARVWTAESADDLHERFVRSPQIGSARFVEKLRRQLADAPAATVQLMAELLFLHLLAPNDIGIVAKRQLLSEVLAISADPVTVPAKLDAALDGGFARTGVAFLTLRDRQMAWLIRLVQEWKRLDPSVRTEALADPWAFRAVLDSIPIEAAYSQRNALLHLAFPGTFESIVSRKHKKAILAAFADRIPAPTGDEDRDLLALRAELQRESGAPVDFYRSELEPRWRSGVAGREAQGWLVRGANVHGQNLISDWLSHGYCSIAFPELPHLPLGLTRAQLSQQLANAHPEMTLRQLSIHAGVLDRFFNQMREGDLVATVNGPSVYIGRIIGPPEQIDSPEHLSDRRRPVRWLNAATPATREQLTDPSRDRLSGQLTVTSLGPQVAEFAAFEDEPPDEPTDVEVGPLVLPEPGQALADRLFLDLGWLSETVDLLREKKQLVLYGPPGTGKTFLAQEIARHLTEQTGGTYRLVQFHPSYAYEDFFEGFRPQAGVAAGTVAFGLEPGPFRLLAAEAAANPAAVHVLVIDEINRANLAKVFGELYFLLEYRDRAVNLQYSPAEEFRLPSNVLLIGTMNTADRSIALVDAAMRRRFAWQGLFPGEAPVAGLLRRWLDAEGLPADRADLLDALNARIDDRDAAIGPSYLMTPQVATEAGLARVWRHYIMPLLEERHAGERIDVHALYGLDQLRGPSGPPAAPNVPAVPEETGGPA